MNREEAKRLDDESLARILVWQIRNRPQRERIEAFGWEVMRLTGEARRTLRMADYGEGLHELLEVQEPEDTAICERLLELLVPETPTNESLFQAAVDRALGSVPPPSPNEIATDAR